MWSAKVSVFFLPTFHASGRGRDAQSWCAAVVARDSSGSCVGLRKASFQRPLGLTVAELLSIREGLMLVADLRTGEFVVESDCKTAVTLLNQSQVFCNNYEGIVTVWESFLCLERLIN